MYNRAMNNLVKQGWLARLELGFAVRRAEAGDKTVWSRRKHVGPLVVQKPFYPESGVCHTYLIHPPGGVVGGDRIEIDIQCEDSAQALITTPAAGKFYRSPDLQASQTQTIRVGEQAQLEWLPQENIYFDDARVIQKTVIDLTGDSRFIGWEMHCLGRLVGQHDFTQGTLLQSMRINRNGIPIVLERLNLQGDHEMMTQAWGLRGNTVFGSLYATPASQACYDALLELQNDDAGFSVTLKESLLLARYLGNDAETMRRTFRRAWQLLRPLILRRVPCDPRIWDT